MWMRVVRMMRVRKMRGRRRNGREDEYPTRSAFSRSCVRFGGGKRGYRGREGGNYDAPLSAMSSPRVKLPLTDTPATCTSPHTYTNAHARTHEHQISAYCCRRPASVHAV